MRRLDTPALVFVLIWTSGYVVGSIAAKAAPPLAVTFWRILLAAALLGSFGLLRGARLPRDMRMLAWLVVSGVLLFAGQFGGIYLGLGSGMPAGTSALIISCCPLVVGITQAVLRWEQLRPAQWVGAALGMVGVVLALLDRISQPRTVGAVAWTLLGLAGFAAGTVLYQRHQPRALDPRLIAAVQCLAACVVLAPWALLSGGLTIPVTGRALGATSWLTFVNAVGGPLIFYYLVRTRGATRTTSLLFVVPATTAIASWPVLGQRLGLTAVAGLVVAGVGVTLIQRRPAADREREASARRAHHPEPAIVVE
jgi:drug/metabolite transporter (DMT)-like permease